LPYFPEKSGAFAGAQHSCGLAAVGIRAFAGMEQAMKEIASSSWMVQKLNSNRTDGARFLRSSAWTVFDG
jgi:hypothetical protein